MTRRHSFYEYENGDRRFHEGAFERRWWAANSLGMDLSVDEMGCVNVALSDQRKVSVFASERSWLAPGLMEREIRADAISAAL